jgi:hypothetical protein
LEKSTRLDAINFAKHGGFPAQSKPVCAMEQRRAVKVAQVCNLPYRRFLTGRVLKWRDRRKVSRVAEFNSAIRRIKNPRYG